MRQNCSNLLHSVTKSEVKRGKGQTGGATAAVAKTTTTLTITYPMHECKDSINK